VPAPTGLVAAGFYARCFEIHNYDALTEAANQFVK
jgi:hypothetical protein